MPVHSDRATLMIALDAAPEGGLIIGPILLIVLLGIVAAVVVLVLLRALAKRRP